MIRTKVVALRYDHFSNQRFRHGCTFLRVREDKLPKDCLVEQVVEHAATQNIATVAATWWNDLPGVLSDRVFAVNANA